MRSRRLAVIALTTALAITTIAPTSSARPRSSGHWSRTRGMHVARIFPMATVLKDGRVLVAGGEDAGTNPIASAEIYTPRRRRWTMTGSMSMPRVFGTATLLNNGKVLVAGGRIDTTTETATAELYDPPTGMWSAAAPMNVVRAVHTATLLEDGRVLVAGGQDNFPQITNAAEIYDPATDTWTNTNPMNTGRYQHTATLLTNGRVLVAGGIDHSLNVTPTAETFDPASGSWTNTASMDTSRYVHAAVRTLLPNGRVLVCGGLSTNGPTFDGTATAETFAPGGLWSPTTTFMTMPRYLETATLLPGGKVLVAGGDGAQATAFAVTNTAELFDPRTGIWSRTGSMHTPRYEQAAVLVRVHRHDRVLVMGGTSSGAPLRSAELYSPARR